VFRATTPDGAPCALKVYEPALLARYGAEVQAERLTRELSLRGHGCRNLVQILGGGPAHVAGRDLTYLAMELVEGVDLPDRIAPGAFAAAPTRAALRDLYQAADYLVQRNYCHRDIKPENIRVRPDGEMVLLVLGVLRPIGGSDLTDTPEARYFVGTLRYAPPE